MRRRTMKSVNRPPTPDINNNNNNGKEDEEENEDVDKLRPTLDQLSLQQLIQFKMLESGEKERLMELLREKLADCGWKSEMESLCRELVKEKGKDNVTVADLVHVITPKGRASIPASIKHELLLRIQTFLASTAL